MVGSSGLYNVLDAILINDHSVIFFNNPAITIVDTAIKYIVVTAPDQMPQALMQRQLVL